MFHRNRVPRIAGGQHGATEDKTEIYGSVYAILNDIKSLLRTALIIYSFISGYTVISYLFGMKERGGGGGWTAGPPSLNLPLTIAT